MRKSKSYRPPQPNALRVQAQETSAPPVAPVSPVPDGSYMGLVRSDRAGFYDVWRMSVVDGAIVDSERVTKHRHLHSAQAVLETEAGEKALSLGRGKS